MVQESDADKCTYQVETPTGVPRQNRKHLQQVCGPMPYRQVVTQWPNEQIFELPPMAALSAGVSLQTSPPPASLGADPPMPMSTPASPMRRASNRARHRPQCLIEQIFFFLGNPGCRRIAALKILRIRIVW